MRNIIIRGLILLPIGTSLSGYIYDIQVARKWQPDLAQYQYVIGCCDFHDKHHAANPLQRTAIEHQVRTYSPAKVQVIVEDLSSSNDKGSVGCGSYYIHSKLGILAGLANFCKHHHISVNNVEYRYCRVVALGPVINNIHVDPAHFSSTKKITIGQLVHEIEHAYQELLVHPFNLAFKALVMKHMNMIVKSQRTLNLQADPCQALATYLQQNSTPLNRIDTVKQLLTFDGILIGLKMADSVLKADHKEKILLFGGGTHINEAFEILQKVGGYTLVSKNSGSLSPLAGSVNTQVDIAGNKPQPVSLEVLTHYLKN